MPSSRRIPHLHRSPSKVIVILNSRKVIAVGPGARDNSGNTIPVGVKEGDTVLYPEYGGTEVKLGEKEYVFFLYVDAVILVRHLLIC
ncbi:putative GroES-like superfamily, groES chaperonin family, groES chaperonin superfamily [Helianthus debilis subsp. tardiflorus]